MIMNKIIPLNEKVFDIIREDADKKFSSGFYKDIYIVKNYIKLKQDFEPETYIDSYFLKILQFIGEEWTDVQDYLEKYEITPLTQLHKAKCIRPINKINYKTPLTIKELLEIHGKKRLLEICENKKDNEYIMWKTGKYFVKNKI